ncbi:MAG: hypothetical protein FWD76_00030 [Firmicutes bacterium]|nr:hypothetical protein [Bacillota bacterium]
MGLFYLSCNLKISELASFAQIIFYLLTFIFTMLPIGINQLFLRPAQEAAQQIVELEKVLDKIAQIYKTPSLLLPEIQAKLVAEVQQISVRYNYPNKKFLRFIYRTISRKIFCQFINTSAYIRTNLERIYGRILSWQSEMGNDGEKLYPSRFNATKIMIEDIANRKRWGKYCENKQKFE